MTDSCPSSPEIGSSKTPVTILQEHLLKHQQLAKYSLIYNGVGTHEPVFKYEVIAAGKLAIGTGKSKKEAKHEAARTILLRLLSEGEEITDDLQDTSSIFTPYSETQKDNAVGSLQDFCTQNNLVLPVYELTRDLGLPHAKMFCTRCTVSCLSETATARTKKQAKQLAARAVLAKLKDCLLELLPRNRHFTREMIAESSAAAVQRLLGTATGNKFRSRFNLGINLADSHRLFDLENKQHPQGLVSIQGENGRFPENPREVLTNICDEIGFGIETDEMESANPQEAVISVTLVSTLSWTFMGWGKDREAALHGAFIEALSFLVTMKPT